MAQQSLIDEPSEPNDATPFLPEKRTLSALREAAAGCRGCHLWRGATQTVFGEGLKRARVMLGATAAKALMGSSFRLTKHRGELLDSELAPILTATIHPSAILRQQDDASRSAEREAFAGDLRVVAKALAG